jgi:hypothetical protein
VPCDDHFAADAHQRVGNATDQVLALGDEGGAGRREQAFAAYRDHAAVDLVAYRHQAGAGASLVTGSNTSQTQGQRRTAIKVAANTWSIT